MKSVFRLIPAALLLCLPAPGGLSACSFGPAPSNDSEESRSSYGDEDDLSVDNAYGGSESSANESYESSDAPQGDGAE